MSKRRKSTKPFVAKKDIHKFMNELAKENDSMGSRYGSAYDDLREKLGMPTQNRGDDDSSDDDGDGDDSETREEMYARYMGGGVR